MNSQQLQLLGSLEAPGSLDTALLALGTAGPGQQLELAVYDANLLPLVLIEALTNALKRGVNVRVQAYRPLLMHQLARLSLPVFAVPSRPPQARMDDCQALVLGGSANSLDKLLAIIEALPKSEACIFIVQHLAENQPNLLDQLLKVRTQYRVLMPQHLVQIQPGTIYISPPGFHMKLANGLVYLTRDPKVEFARPSVDVLFESVAAEYGPRALAILLCGYGQDGTAGCAAIRRAGGLVFTQDSIDCEGADTMPSSAHKAGHSDKALSLPCLISLAAAALSPRTPEASAPLLELFLKALHSSSGYDYRRYQRQSLERRITTLIKQYGHPSFFDYQRTLFGDPQEIHFLLTEISIKVTEFFRHPEQFALLRHEVLPYLDSFPLIKAWSAGCATGEEAYSLAILLDELGLAKKSRLFATDINPYALELAQSGLFPRQVLAQSQANYAKTIENKAEALAACRTWIVESENRPQRAQFLPDLQPNSPAIRQKYGEKCAAAVDLQPTTSESDRLLGRYLIDQGLYLEAAPRLKDRLLFHHHALGHDGVFNEFELILCRNVMIYFDIEMQRQVLKLFAQSLHREGFLMLGPSDGLTLLAREAGFRPDPRGQHLYRLEARP